MTKIYSHSQKYLGKHLIGVLITVICILIIASKVNIPELSNALISFQWPYFIAAIASLALGYSLRIARWQLLLSFGGGEINYLNCASPFLGSVALNNLLPLRLGDVIRALVFPSAMGISRTVATSSLVVERLIDLITLLCCFAIGTSAITAANIPAGLKHGIIGLTIVTIFSLLMCMLLSKALSHLFQSLSLKFSNKLSLILSTISKLLFDIHGMTRPNRLMTIIPLSLLIWFAETGLFYFILVGSGLTPSYISALFLASTATLSTLVPSSPGFIGPFHLAAFTAIGLMNGTSSQAASVAILSHLSLWASTTLAGAMAIWMRPELFQSLKTQRINS